MAPRRGFLSPLDLQRTRRWHMVRRITLRCACLVLVLLTPGCSTGYWGWRPLGQFDAVDPRDRVRIWSRGALNEWHAVVITDDSVSGIPYEMSLSCDTCRRALLRTQVDSIKLDYQGGHLDSKMALQVAGAVALALLAEAAVCAATHAC
jgi:hypothetical protein